MLTRERLEARLKSVGLKYTVNRKGEWFAVKVFGDPPGLCGISSNSSLEEALESAMIQMNIDWNSVDRKMTEHEWSKMSHQ